jgi:hypothetical protein
MVFPTHPSLVDNCKPLPSVGKIDHAIVLVDLRISPTIAKTQHLKTATRGLRKAHDKYIDDVLLGDMHNEPKRVWSYLKGK